MPEDDALAEAMAEFRQNAQRMADCMTDMAAVAARMEKLMIEDVRQMLEGLAEIEEQTRRNAASETGERE